jgi:hypothetical protein
LAERNGRPLPARGADDLGMSFCSVLAFAIVVGRLAIPSRIALTDYIGNNIDREREPKRVPRGSKRAREEGNDRA